MNRSNQNNEIDNLEDMIRTKTVITLKAVALAWLSGVEGTVKANTFHHTYYTNVHKHIIPVLGNYDISKIKRPHIQQFFNNKASEYSIDTLKKIKYCLSNIFRYAIDLQYCEVDPTIQVKIRSTKQSCDKNAYNQEQANYIKEFALTHRFGTEIIMLIELGLRRSELLAIKWCDVDFENASIHIRRTVADIYDVGTGKYEIVIGETKNRSSTRVIPIPTDVLTLLILKRNRLKISHMLNDDDFIFKNQYNKVNSPRSWSKAHYMKFMKDMRNFYMEQGIDIPIYNPHELRHTRASIWVNQGKNLYAVAKTLGHSDLKMLQKRYAHSDVNDLRNLLGMK